VNGLRLKLFGFSVRGELVEPQKNTFARGSGVNNKTIEGTEGGNKISHNILISNFFSVLLTCKLFKFCKDFCVGFCLYLSEVMRFLYCFLLISL